MQAQHALGFSSFTSVSRLDGISLDSQNIRMGGGTSIILELNGNPRGAKFLSLQTELQLSLAKGNTFKNISNNENSLHYLNIPMMAKIRMGGTPLEINIPLGIYTGFLLNDPKLHYDNSNGIAKINRVDFGGVGGMGILGSVGKKLNVYGDVRLTKSWIKITTIQDNKIRNKSIYFSCGLLWSLKKSD